MPRFTTKRAKVQIVVEDETGQERYMTLVEMMGDQRDQYLTLMGARIKVGSNGEPVGISNFDGLQSSLITRCLVDEDGKPVPENRIKKWPASCQVGLFDLCQKMNRLTKEAQEEAKKP